MKKNFLNLAVIVAVFSSLSMTASPVYFEGIFSGNSIPSDWTQYGVDSTVVEKYAALFPKYSASNSYSIQTLSLNQVALSPSEFENGASSDQWLVTPEFTISDPYAMLTYTVYVEGNKARNTFKVLLSESGSGKDDFSTTLLTSSITGKGSVVSSSSKRLALKDYEGKKVRLAFVNEGNTSGVLGFGNIRVAQYDLTYNEGNVSRIVVESTTVQPAFSVKLSTPVAATGLTAVLTTSNGYTSTFTNTYSYGSGLSSSAEIVFPDLFSMGKSTVVDYTLTITPNFEGARPTVIYGTFVKPEYPAVAVMEEFTGTWCGWCPRGTAFMNYYRDTYGMIEGKDRFIGMAVHVQDVMTPAYLSELTQVIQIPGYPYACINRKTGGDPSEIDVKGALKTKSLADTKIVRINFDPDKGNAISVDYGIALCYDTEIPNVGVSAYIIENDVHSNDAAYAQANNFYQFSAADVAGAYGQQMVPYFEPYLDMTVDLVPPASMSYNDVGRCASPSVIGEPFNNNMKAFVFSPGTISLEMPATVMNRSNTDLVLLVTDLSSNYIVAADIVPYAKFNEELFELTEEPIYPEGYDPTGDVSDIRLQSEIIVEDGILKINTPVEATAKVFTSDGQHILSSLLKSGANTIQVDDNGLLVILIESQSGSSVHKIIL